MRNERNILWPSGLVVAYNTVEATKPFDGYTFLKNTSFCDKILLNLNYRPGRKDPYSLYKSRSRSLRAGQAALRRQSWAGDGRL